ncbi:30S ribosomal protein S3 [bacterium]|jgi:small subunit ribosomal protein S3|nr:30S ribosomal protein S3 [bacterium]
MGQKVHPKGLRLGIVEDWDSIWYANREYKDYILEDLKIRGYIQTEMKRAGIAHISIHRRAEKIDITIKAARSGMILGKGGEQVVAHRKTLAKLLGKPVRINVTEQKDPEKSARLLGEIVCAQLERRFPFRRAMKMGIQLAMKAGAQGVKICCAGRLGGVEIARTEWYREGKVPLHTLRASIDYAFTESLTTYGKIGVKVWIYNGDIYEHKQLQRKELQDPQPRRDVPENSRVAAGA